jgi:hypothetical protein
MGKNAVNDYIKKEAKKPEPETNITPMNQYRSYWNPEPVKNTFKDKIILFLTYVIIISQLLGVAVVNLLLLYGLYSFIKYG